MKIICVKSKPEYKEKAIKYIHSKWGNKNSYNFFNDCISHSITTLNPLPLWYLLEDEGKIIGCAGLIENDFISRMDLYPWFCSLYVDKEYRGRCLGKKLIRRVKYDARQLGFSKIYLNTDLNGYYEKLGFTYIGDGYFPWGNKSKIYESD